MSRFREEVYAAPWYKKSLQRRDNKTGEVSSEEGRPSRSVDEERRALRSEFFSKRSKKAPKATQEQRRLDIA